AIAEVRPLVRARAETVVDVQGGEPDAEPGRQFAERMQQNDRIDAPAQSRDQLRAVQLRSAHSLLHTERDVVRCSARASHVTFSRIEPRSLPFKGRVRVGWGWRDERQRSGTSLNLPNSMSFAKRA